MTVKAKLCAYFQSEGHCKFGDNCRYIHAPRPQLLHNQDSDVRFSQLLLQKLSSAQKLKTFSQLEDNATKSLKELLLMKASMIDSPVIQSRLRDLLLAKENQWTHLLEIFLQSFPNYKDKNSPYYGESFTYFLKASWRIRNRIVHLQQGESPEVYLLDVLGSLVPLVKRLIEIQGIQHLIDMDYNSQNYEGSINSADTRPTRHTINSQSPPGLLSTPSLSGLSVDSQTSRPSANKELRAINSQSESIKESSERQTAGDEAQSKSHQDKKSSKGYLTRFFTLWSQTKANSDEAPKAPAPKEGDFNQALNQNTANEAQSQSQTDYSEGVGKQAMRLYLEKFGVLINVLERISATDPTPLRSRVGIELRQADPLVFLKAGCANFKEYIALAEEHDVVSSIGAGSYARLALKSNFSRDSPVQSNVIKSA